MPVERILLEIHLIICIIIWINDEIGGYHTEWREVVTGYNTVHHDAVYETRYVVDSPATTKQELTGYKCSSCGKTKAN